MRNYFTQAYTQRTWNPKKFSSNQRQGATFNKSGSFNGSSTFNNANITQFNNANSTQFKTAITPFNNGNTSTKFDTSLKGTMPPLYPASPLSSCYSSVMSPG